MKIVFKSFLFLMTAFFIAPTIADNFAPCGPGTYVYAGDPQASVISRCGNPTSTQEYTAQNEIKTKRVRWIYNPNGAANVAGTIVTTQGVPFTVEFIDEKVTNIIVAGESYNTFNHCSVLPGISRKISVGDDMNRVRSMCGPPIFTNTDEKSESGTPQATIEYRYVFDPVLPPTIVTIQNGIVTQVK